MRDAGGLRRLIRFPWRSRKRIRRDIDDEFQFHLDMRVAELVARGLTPDEARREAMRSFGDVGDAREYCRSMDERTTTEQKRRDWFAELGSDIRFAARQMRRSPVFTVLAILTLSLGIGATTAIFSVVNRLLLNPIPFADGDRIVNLNRENLQGTLFVTPTPQLVDAWRKGVRSLEEIATYGWQEVIADGGDEPEEIEAYFPELRKLVQNCQFSDCTHTHEPNCAVLAALKEGRVHPERFESFLRLRAGQE